MLKQSVVGVRLDCHENLNNCIVREVQEPAIPTTALDTRSVRLIALVVVEGNVTCEAVFTVLPVLNVSDDLLGEFSPHKVRNEGLQVFA